MYVAGVSAKIAKDISQKYIPKNAKKQTFYFIARFKQFIVLPKLVEYQF